MQDPTTDIVNTSAPFDSLRSLRELGATRFAGAANRGGGMMNP